MSDGFSDMMRGIEETRKPQCRALALTNQSNACVLHDGHEGQHENCDGRKFTQHVRGVGELNDAIARLCACPEHKRYRAVRKPRVACEGCWRLWCIAHPGWELETRWMR